MSIIINPFYTQTTDGVIILCPHNKSRLNQQQFLFHIFSFRVGTPFQIFFWRIYFLFGGHLNS